MKARIKKTGEIVDIISYNHCSTIRSSQDFVSYIDSNGVEHDRESLNYYWDFEPIDNAENDAHWQDVRERAAIAAMQSIIPIIYKKLDTFNAESVAKHSVQYADALVEQLKGK